MHPDENSSLWQWSVTQHRSRMVDFVMTDKTSVDPPDKYSNDEEMFPTLTAAQLARIAGHGHVRHVGSRRGVASKAGSAFEVKW